MFINFRTNLFVFILWSSGLCCHVVLQVVANISDEPVVSFFTPTLKTEAIYFFKMLVNTYKTAWQHNPVEDNLNFHHYRNFKSHTVFIHLERLNFNLLLDVHFKIKLIVKFVL
jgi:hypothetical protein